MFVFKYITLEVVLVQWNKNGQEKRDQVCRY